MTLPDEGGVDRPTVAGLLTFGTEPTGFLPSSSTEAACYTGERLSSDDPVHAERLAGRAPDQIDAAVAFAAQFMRHPTHARPAGTSAPRYDLDVVHEAIVNALAHRDYAISGSKIPPLPLRRPARALQPRRAAQHHHPRRDALYHSDATLVALDEVGVRSHVSKPERGRRCWQDKRTGEKLTARSPATNSWSASCPASAASAPGRCSSSLEAKACRRSFSGARRTPAGDPSTRCSVTSSG